MSYSFRFALENSNLVFFQITNPCNKWANIAKFSYSFFNFVSNDKVYFLSARGVWLLLINFLFQLLCVVQVTEQWDKTYHYHVGSDNYFSISPIFCALMLLW